MLILCVDDDRLVRCVTGNMLRELGHEVIEVADGDAALASLHNCGRTVDVMMTDVRMPGMTGFTLARRAKADHPDLEVIFMTGFADGPMPPGPILHKPATLKRLETMMRTAAWA
jgi:CheY-like chemotaxis protein